LQSLRLLALFGAALCALHAGAQVSVDSVIPPAPTSNDILFARIVVPGLCDESFTTVITGSSVRTDVLISGCMGGPPPFDVVREAPFGPLAAGTYSYEVYVRFDTDPDPVLIHEQTIVVSPAAATAAVPAVGRLELILLSLALSAVALVSLRRSA